MQEQSQPVYSLWIFVPINPALSPDSLFVWPLHDGTMKLIYKHIMMY